MGLDIYAISTYTELTGGEYDDDNDVYVKDGKEIECYMLPINNDFPNQHKGLPRYIEYPTNWDTSFRAGSYGGYNQFRNTLAKVAGYVEYENGQYDQTVWNLAEQGENGPFIELIYFSDCEGCINSETSKKLLKDFIDFDAKAQLEDEWFYEKYTYWQEAFEVASSSEKGVVLFG